jgi:two-component system OmpR family sensor kinase
MRLSLDDVLPALSGRLAGGPAPALADRSRLEHVISNLVDNALRHSPEGKTVVVTTWRSERGSGITVADQGPGMPPEILEHVFDRFFRGDPARGGPAESSGLGLAICKEIVSAHGGEIWVTSRPGDGSAFSLSIPSNES